MGAQSSCVGEGNVIISRKLLTTLLSGSTQSPNRKPSRVNMEKASLHLANICHTNKTRAEPTEKTGKENVPFLGRRH
jgi:hypothetical protein